MDLSKSFDFEHTLGDADVPPPLPAANPLPDLVAALQDPRSWSAQLPSGGHMLVALRQLQVGPGVVLAHPLGTLTVTQTVVPLNLTIDRYGGAMLAGDRRFSIGPVSLGDDNDPPVSPVRDWFAPASSSIFPTPSAYPDPPSNVWTPACAWAPTKSLTAVVGPARSSS